MRISRPCYDKFHRCPGWNGGGLKYARVDRCDDGRIVVDYEVRLWRWRFWRCNKCDVIVLPYMSRWLDPSWVVDHVRTRVEWWWMRRTR